MLTTCPALLHLTCGGAPRRSAMHAGFCAGLAACQECKEKRCTVAAAYSFEAARLDLRQPVDKQTHRILDHLPTSIFSDQDPSYVSHQLLSVVTLDAPVPSAPTRLAWL